MIILICLISILNGGLTQCSDNKSIQNDKGKCVAPQTLMEGCFDFTPESTLENLVCSKCTSFYNLSNGKCLKGEIDKWVEYIDDDNCKECLNGYVLDENNQCIECPDDCLKCSSVNTCDECKGIYINGNCQKAIDSHCLDLVSTKTKSVYKWMWNWIYF